MQDIIKGLEGIEWSQLLITLCFLAAALKGIIELFGWTFNEFGVEFRFIRERREQKELLENTTTRLKNLEDQRVIDVEQSIKHDKVIKDDLSKVSEVVGEISRKLDDMKDENDRTEMAKLKDALVGYYKEFKDIGKWSKLEKDAFFSLLKRYKAHGGNSYVENTIEPFMHELEVVDDKED